MMIDKKVVALKEMADAVSRFLNDHGYSIKFDKDADCWRIVLEGIDSKDDSYYPVQFSSIMGATYRALQLASGENR